MTSARRNSATEQRRPRERGVTWGLLQDFSIVDVLHHFNKCVLVLLDKFWSCSTVVGLGLNEVQFRLDLNLRVFKGGGGLGSSWLDGRKRAERPQEIPLSKPFFRKQNSKKKVVVVTLPVVESRVIITRMMMMTHQSRDHNSRTTVQKLELEKNPIFFVSFFLYLFFKKNQITRRGGASINQPLLRCSPPSVMNGLIIRRLDGESSHHHHHA